MTLQGIDISNLQGSPEVYRDEQWYVDAQFVIVQAIPRPKLNGLAGDQLRAARDDGKKIGIYTWLWHDPSWRLDSDVGNDQRARLATVPDDVALDMRVFLDVEDDRSAAWAASGLQGRKDDVQLALDALNEWSASRGLPEVGIYTSRYYIDRLLNGWLPDSVKLWLAGYGIEPGSLIGGDVVAHQYTSTPIDMDVMIESEIVTGDAPVDDAERLAMQDKINGLVNSLGYISFDLLKPVAKQKTASKAVQNLVAGIRSQADQQGVAHA